MAPMAPTKYFLIFLLLITLFTYSSSSSLQHLKETKMTLYFLDLLTGSNATFVKVAGIPSNRWSFGDFGTIYVNDDIITETLNPDSPVVARGQGIYMVSSLDGSSSYSSLSLVFISKAYAGSTLEMQGVFVQTADVSEISIVSGTGKFRFARGYAIFEMITFNSTHVIARCNITVRLG